MLDAGQDDGAARGASRSGELTRLRGGDDGVGLAVDQEQRTITPGTGRPNGHEVVGANAER